MAFTAIMHKIFQELERSINQKTEETRCSVGKVYKKNLKKQRCKKNRFENTSRGM